MQTRQRCTAKNHLCMGTCFSAPTLSLAYVPYVFTGIYPIKLRLSSALGELKCQILRLVTFFYFTDLTRCFFTNEDFSDTK